MTFIQSQAGLHTGDSGSILDVAVITSYGKRCQENPHVSRSLRARIKIFLTERGVEVPPKEQETRSGPASQKGRVIIPALAQMIISIQHNVLLVWDTYAKFTAKLVAQYVENKPRNEALHSSVNVLQPVPMEKLQHVRRHMTGIDDKGLQMKSVVHLNVFPSGFPQDVKVIFYLKEDDIRRARGPGDWITTAYSSPREIQYTWQLMPTPPFELFPSVHNTTQFLFGMPAAQMKQSTIIIHWYVALNAAAAVTRSYRSTHATPSEIFASNQRNVQLVGRGVKQGDPLSATLFILVVDLIIKQLEIREGQNFDEVVAPTEEEEEEEEGGQSRRYFPIPIILPILYTSP
ncbi:hypothetical protein ANN_00877 [Periplaneta americana]|uniref:Uncharacterized protein n=1 Tax=Periplaneta americana TaxID=6978 RepID=A0ABQ8TUF7_PERAM|nr:hypothetical protein ANN_00877 [Periplaneta americana]